MNSETNKIRREARRIVGGTAIERDELDRQQELEKAKERELMKEDSEYKRAHDAVFSSTRAFSTLFRTRMYDILNDEQRRRLQELIDNPPLYVRMHIQRLMNERGENVPGSWNKKAVGDKDVWTPGPDAWKPGDPLPESFWQEKDTRRRFPKEEN